MRSKLVAPLLVSLAALLSCGGPVSESNVDKNGKIIRGEATPAQTEGFEDYCGALVERDQNVQSVMVVQGGKVIFERWMNGGAADEPHVLNSVSKTFTSIAVGFAIDEGLLKLDDRLVDIFPDKVPEEVSDNLAAITVRSLLTMSCGHDPDPSGYAIWKEDTATGFDWVERFLQVPVVHEPGTFFCYNSVGTYVLSAIVQKLSGEKVVDYLQTRLFGPLDIDYPQWNLSPQGICCGGWGLYLKTEDLAKTGQCLLQDGKWNGQQVIPAWWVKEMSSYQKDNSNTGNTIDWVQGYGYQMWRCTHNAFRADGANGQYIIVIPEKDAVVAITADLGDMQAELNTVWDYIYPVL